MSIGLISKMKEEAEDFVIENGVLKEYRGAGGAVVIPDSVTEIEGRAFYGCSSLTSVTIRKIVLTKEMIEAFQNYHDVSFSDVLTRIVDYSVRKPDMSVEDFESIAKQCRHITNQLALGGRGDPNQHKDFERLLSKKFYCSSETKKLLISEKRCTVFISDIKNSGQCFCYETPAAIVHYPVCQQAFC